MPIINIFPNQDIQNVLDKYQKDIEAVEETVIIIHAGIYNQRVHVIGRNIKILGQGIVVISNSLGAKQIGHNQTFHTATFLCEGENIELTNLIIINNAGLGNKVGQSIALYLNGDKFYLNDCIMLSYQDTLCLGPVIQVNRDKTITSTPVKNPQLKKARYIFRRCTVQGNIDYIFGGGSALFFNCKINSIFSNEGENYICAPCTNQGRKYGFIFYHCMINSKGNQQANYLGRPWREFAKAYFISCKMSSDLLKKGWHYWGNDPVSVKKADFRVYQPNGKMVCQQWALISDSVEDKLIDSLQRYFNISL
ncbi:pectinesterase family protein [uncultured Limosilactobacillus sp.]|uniref:pectinesterase family protein n=1 Tax=uncultured Limosilactobacillus sp. TaxID=2837629 RepID=UPI00265ED167|nr:pectinesterase family protein [uncultured Limosilactobacillus sp.]